MVLAWIALGTFALLVFLGLILTVFGIGGTFLVLTGAAIYNLITWSWKIPLLTIGILAGLAVAGEIIEWLIMTHASKKRGVSWTGVLGTIAGAIIGAMLLSPLMPIIGSILGIFVGAILGAYLLELLRTQNTKKAWTAAKAAFRGRAAVSITKTLLLAIQVWLVLRTVL